MATLVEEQRRVGKMLEDQLVSVAGWRDGLDLGDENHQLLDSPRAGRGLLPHGQASGNQLALCSTRNGSGRYTRSVSGWPLAWAALIA